MDRPDLSDRSDALDDLAWLAAQVCAVPHGFVALAGGSGEGQAVCEHALAQAEAVMELPDAQADARFAQPPLVLGGAPVRFLAAALLRPPGAAPLGVLCVADALPRTLLPEQRRALAVLANQAVAQLLLRRLSPPAPGPSPQADAAVLDHHLAQEWDRHARRSEPLATLVMAVEGGRADDDAVVRQLVGEALRTSDHIAPLGGSRLAAVLPGSGLGTAMTAAQRVRHAVERHGWGSSPVTLSLGVAALVPVPAGDPTQLRARAEHALQLAQRQGRNRVAAFSGW